MSAQSEKIWTVLDLLKWTTEHFKEAGVESPRLDAECLLAHALDCERLRLYLDFDKPVEAPERARFRELVRARASERVPVALLTGVREFWSLPIAVNRDVLVPRPESELLVEWVLGEVPEPGDGHSLLEIGTGSGAIALAIATERAGLAIAATDLSPSACKCAEENALRLELAERAEPIRWLEGDLFAPIVGERFSLLVSNPPYVASGERGSLPPELAHEPETALFAGEDGLAVLRPLISGAPAYLLPGGALACECDPRQIGALHDIALAAGFETTTVLLDAAGRERVLCARLPESQ